VGQAVAVVVDPVGAVGALGGVGRRPAAGVGGVVDGAVAVVVNAVLAVELLGVVGRRTAARVVGIVDQPVAVVVDAVAARRRREVGDPALGIALGIHPPTHHGVAPAHDVGDAER